MLGSYDEAEEAVQEALLRAWRSLRTYEGRAPLRHWLFRITTTTCLKAIGSRARRPAVTGEITYLQPYPDRLLDQLTDRDSDPAIVIERRETVALSFIVALQRLPASQRAALILRDVLAWSSAEVAELLETTVPAVNSLLQRARLILRTVTGPASRGPLSPGTATSPTGSWPPGSAVTSRPWPRCCARTRSCGFRRRPLSSRAVTR